MSGGVIETSVLPDIANAGSSVLNAAGQGAGWLKQQFDQTSPNTQKWLLAAVGLIGGAVLGNVAASLSGQQGTWGGTAMKWGIALAAMTFLSSEQSPLRTALEGSPTRETPLTAETDPRNPWRDTNNDGRPDTFTPTREVRPALPTPG